MTLLFQKNYRIVTKKLALFAGLEFASQVVIQVAFYGNSYNDYWLLAVAALYLLYLIGKDRGIFNLEALKRELNM